MNLTKIWELFCIYHLGQVQNVNCTGVWSSSGRLALVGLFWQTICAVLIPGSWKWATNWRIILVFSQPVCSNLNHRTRPRRLETRSGNSISCVPDTCHRSVLTACPEKPSKTAAVTGHLSAPRNTTGQLPQLGLFSLKLPLHQRSQVKPEGDGDIPLAVAPVVPRSRSVTLCSHFDFTKVQFSSVGSNLPKNRALLQTGWVHCSASG